MDSYSPRNVIQESINGPVISAWVADMSGPEVVSSFDLSFNAAYPSRMRLVRRLRELCAQDTKNTRHVRALIETIEAVVSTLPRQKQRSADSTIVELTLALPIEEQQAIASEFVQHQRTSRRLSGYRLIKLLPGCDLSAVLLSSYVTYRDAAGLRALVFIEADISNLPDLRTAIAGLRERYYQARVIENLLANNRTLAVQLADEFPMAFIWASGRRRDATARDFVVHYFEATLRKVEAVRSIDRHLIAGTIELKNLIWALGRVGARDQLIALASKYNVDLTLNENTSMLGQHTFV